MKLATRVLAFATLGTASTLDQDTGMTFEEFVSVFGRDYSDGEYDMRKAIFEENVLRIQELNAQDNSYKLAINEFADVARGEFRRKMFGMKKPRAEGFLGATRKSPSYLGRHKYSGSPVPESVDWSTLGAVTPVKNQQMCGSCYAFSATGALEGRHEIATGKLLSLSEQQIVDCSQDQGNNGCNGGIMDFVFQYVSEKGICAEEGYTYVAEEQETCKAQTCLPVIPPGEVKGYNDVHPKDTEALMEALAEGPVAVAIEADETVFQFYKSGVLTAHCGENLDHGVLAVGYGTNEKGEKFWKVKNSWGADWGDHGYIYLTRDVAGPGECGILMMASYPVLKVPKSADEPVDVEEM